MTDKAPTEHGYIGKCQYKTGKCFKERTLKRNGQAHSLCEEHRIKQNLIQRRSDRKYQSLHAVRRKERSQLKAMFKKQVSLAVANQMYHKMLHQPTPASQSSPAPILPPPPPLTFTPTLAPPLPPPPATATIIHPALGLPKSPYNSPIVAKPPAILLPQVISPLGNDNTLPSLPHREFAKPSTTAAALPEEKRSWRDAKVEMDVPSDIWTEDDVKLLQSILLV
ncbi:hypothetical protein AC1031_014429 [Aphanomyces cochlioides]|nr:hypothetical protein AC1031_014429 [Aphanomyces cochlioides]